MFSVKTYPQGPRIGVGHTLQSEQTFPEPVLPFQPNMGMPAFVTLPTGQQLPNSELMAPPVGQEPIPNVQIQEPVPAQDFSGMFPTYYPPMEVPPLPPNTDNVMRSQYGIPSGVTFSQGKTMQTFGQPQGTAPIVETTAPTDNTALSGQTTTVPVTNPYPQQTPQYSIIDETMKSLDELPVEITYDTPQAGTMPPMPTGMLSNTPIPTVTPGQLPVTNAFPTAQGPLPGTQDRQGTPTVTGQPTTEEEQKRQFSPEDYYGLKGILDMGALMNNIIQAPPPSLQFQMPHFERMRMDRTPFEQMRTEVQQTGRESYRGLREGISQASDLMKGLAAVTSGTQENMANIGSQEAQQKLQVEQTNQQIAMQENQQQSATINQEAQTNYQIQQQAQMFKDQMINEQMANSLSTLGAYTDFINRKEEAAKATELSKNQTTLANDVQVQMLKYAATQNELASSGYQEAETQNMYNYMMNVQKDLYNSPEYAALKEHYGDDYEIRTIDANAQQHKANQALYDTWTKIYKGFTETPVKGQGAGVDPAETDDMYKLRLDKWNNKKGEYEKMKQIVEGNSKIIDLEQKFYNQLKGSFDKSGERARFQSSYLKEKGLPTTEEYVQTLESLMQSARQF